LLNLIYVLARKEQQAGNTGIETARMSQGSRCAAARPLHNGHVTNGVHQARISNPASLVSDNGAATGQTRYARQRTDHPKEFLYF